MPFTIDDAPSLGAACTCAASQLGWFFLAELYFKRLSLPHQCGIAPQILILIASL